METNCRTMLPDYARVRTKFRDAYIKRLLNSNRQALGPLNEAPRFVLQEGDQLIIQREDGTESLMPFREISAEMSFKKSELSKLTPQEIVKRIDEAAISMARQQVDHSLSTIVKELEKTGRTIDAKGEVFGPKHVFELFESVSINFENGIPRLPTVMGSPAIQEKYRAALREIEANPELSTKMRDILEKKRQEWNDREADRRLVD